MRKAIPKVQTDNEDLSRVQDHILSALNPLLKEAGVGTVPTGVVLPFAGSTPPTGYLLCDGAAVSRGAYGPLFSVIGTAFGAGDGVSTFNLPDLRGRVAVGVGQGAGLSSRAAGATGGEETHALSVTEMPEHAHEHQYAYTGDDNTMWHANQQAAVAAGADNPTISSGGGAVRPAGGGAAHENMPPFLALNQIIKT